MIYLKSVLAGIAGSIVALILLIVVIIILNVTKATGSGMVGIGIISFLPLGMILLGFAAGFYLMFRRSSRRAGSVN